MADDFRVSCAFFAHPKTKKLRRQAGAQAVIDLMRLWAWVAVNRPDGNLANLTDSDIEDAIDWEDGAPGSFVALLVDLRWIDGPPDARVVHDWFEHNTWAATKKQRTDKAKKAAAARWGGTGEQPQLDLPNPEDATGNATSIEVDAPSIGVDAPSNANSTSEQCPPLLSSPLLSTHTQSACATPASPDDKSDAEVLALVLKRAGCPDATEHHPAIQAAVAEQLSPAALRELAQDPKNHGKPALYLVNTLRGRLKDAIAVAGSMAQRVVTSAALGTSPPREPESPVQAAEAFATHCVRTGHMSPDDALAYVTEAKQKHQPQGATP